MTRNTNEHDMNQLKFFTIMTDMHGLHFLAYYRFRTQSKQFKHLLITLQITRNEI